MNTFSVLQEHETARCRYDIDDIVNDKEQLAIANTQDCLSDEYR